VIGWETALAVYLTASFVTAVLLGRRLAAVRRRYPLVLRPQPPTERRRRR
jgi:hypothetical protein